MGYVRFGALFVVAMMGSCGAISGPIPPSETPELAADVATLKANFAACDMTKTVLEKRVATLEDEVTKLVAFAEGQNSIHLIFNLGGADERDMGRSSPGSPCYYSDAFGGTVCFEGSAIYYDGLDCTGQAFVLQANNPNRLYYDGVNGNVFSVGPMTSIKPQSKSEPGIGCLRILDAPSKIYPSLIRKGAIPIATEDNLSWQPR